MDSSESSESNSAEEESESIQSPDSPHVNLKLYTKNYDLHRITVSTTARFCPDVAQPAMNVLEDSQFWVDPTAADKVLNIPLIRNHLVNEGRIQKDHFLWIIDRVYDILSEEPNVLNVPAPITVCGDVHGQFYDMLKIFELGGDPANTTYLWLGDYVDRGNFSVEVLILLYSYKITYPDNFFMLRGNHECRHLTEYFTFKEECLYKYDLEIYDAVMDTFDALPLVAIMNQQFFCVHGGLSPSLHTIEDVSAIDRFVEPSSSGLMCDLLWADPMEVFAPESNSLEWEPNELRKTSWSFSYNATCKFLDQHKFLSVIRAHEAQDAGYRMYLKNFSTGFPSLITLFSAPNYLSNFNNKGAILRYENNILNIRQFNNSAQPYYLPKFMNVFEWSLPFVAEKLGELVLVFLNLVNDDEADQEEEQERIKNEELARKQELLRQKVQSVGRMLALFKKLRQERETGIALGHLADGRPTLQFEEAKQTLSTTETVRQYEKANEARPAQGLESPTRTPVTRRKTREAKEPVRLLKRSDSRGSLNARIPLISTLTEEENPPRK